MLLLCITSYATCFPMHISLDPNSTVRTYNEYSCKRAYICLMWIIFVLCELWQHAYTRFLRMMSAYERLCFHRHTYRDIITCSLASTVWARKISEFGLGIANSGGWGVQRDRWTSELDNYFGAEWIRGSWFEIGPLLDVCTHCQPGHSPSIISIYILNFNFLFAHPRAYLPFYDDIWQKCAKITLSAPNPGQGNSCAAKAAANSWGGGGVVAHTYVSMCIEVLMPSYVR